MQNKIVSTLSLVLLFSLATQAQDYIHKKNREILKVKLIEVGTDEIKFKDFDNPDGPIFSIEKEKVSKVEIYLFLIIFTYSFLEILTLKTKLLMIVFLKAFTII